MARRRKTNYPPTSFEAGGGPAHHGEGSEPPPTYPETSYGAGGGPGRGPSTPTTSSQAAAAATAAANAQAGPTVAESSSYRRAARQQAALIQEYALNNEQSKLESKHYEFDNQNRIKKQKATNEQIHADLVKSRGNVKRTTARLFSNPRIYAANVKGKVVGPKRIARIDSHIKQREGRVDRKAAQLQRDAPAPMSDKEARATAKKVIYEKKHPGKVYNVGSGESATAIGPEKAAINELLPDAKKSYDIFINPKTGKPEHFRDYAPAGVRFIEDFVGHDPYASAGDIGHALEVSGLAAATVAPTGIGQAARALAVLKTAERVAAAGRAAEVPGFVGAARGARTVGTVGEVTGEAAAGTSRARRAAAAAKAYYGKPARSVRSAERLAGAARYGFNPITPAVLNTDQVQRDIEGTLSANVLQSAKTTGKAIPATLSFLATVAADAGIAATTGDTAPLEGAAREFKKATLGALEPYVSGSAEDVRRATEENTGYIFAPLVPKGLSVAGRVAARAGTRAARTGAARGISRILPERKVPEHATGPGKLREYGQVLAGRKTRKHIAVLFERELGPSRRASEAALKEILKPLRKGKLLKDDEAAALLNVIVRHGISKENARAQLRAVEKALDPADKKAGVNVQEVADYVERNPEILDNKHLWDAVDAARSRLRDVETSPRAARLAQARVLSRDLQEKILYPEDRVPAKAREHTDAVSREDAWADYENLQLKVKDLRNIARELETRAKEATGPAHPPSGRVTHHTADGDVEVVHVPAKGEGGRVMGTRTPLLWYSTRRHSGAVNTDEFDFPEKAQLFVGPVGWTHSRMERALVKRGLVDPKHFGTRAAIEGDRLTWQDRPGPESKVDGQDAAEAAIQKEFPSIKPAGYKTYGHAQGVLDILSKPKTPPMKVGSRRQQLLGEARQVRAEAKVLQKRAKPLHAALKPYKRPEAKVSHLTKRKDYDRQMVDEFVNEVDALAKEHGWTRPSWVSERTPSGTAPVMPGFPTPASRAQFKSTGEAARLDIADRSIEALARDSIYGPRMRPAVHRVVQRFLDDFAVEKRLADPRAAFGGGPRHVFDQNEVARLTKDSKFDPRKEVLIPQAQWGRALDDYENFAPDGAMDFVHSNISQRIKNEKLWMADEPGTKYVIVKREAAKEFMDQINPSGGYIENALSHLGGFASWSILYSPAWALAQIVNEGSQFLAAMPNPLVSARAMHTLAKLKKEKPRVYEAFAGRAAPAAAPSAMPTDMRVHMGATGHKTFSDAFAGIRSNRVGRIIYGTGNIFRAFDKWKTGRYRTVLAAAKVDKELNGFMNGMRGMLKEQDAISKKLSGMNRVEQLEYMTKHPKLFDKHLDYVDDVAGNFGAYTRFEKAFGPAAIFYGYLRMSMRWTFWSYPMRHPVKAQLLYLLAQQNREELTKLMNRDPGPHIEPSFLQYGIPVIHSGPGGEVGGVLPGGTRFGAPSSNVITQAIGDDNLAGLVRGLNPVLSTAVFAMTGLDPMSGKQDPNVNRGALLLNQLLSLSPAARLLELNNIGKEQSEASKAYAALDPGKNLRSYLFPFLPLDAESFVQQAKLGENLGKAGTGVESEYAQVLDMIERFGAAGTKERLRQQAQGREALKQSPLLPDLPKLTPEQQSVIDLFNKLKYGGDEPAKKTGGTGYGSIDFGGGEGGGYGGRDPYGDYGYGYHKKDKKGGGGYGYSPAAPLSARDKRVDKTLSKLIADPGESLDPLNASEKKLWTDLPTAERTAAINRAEKKGLYDKAIEKAAVKEARAKGPGWEMDKAVRHVTQALRTAAVAPRVYERLWKKTGLPGPMPDLELNAPPVTAKEGFKAAGYVTDEGVHLSKSTSRQLAKRMPEAKVTLLHEFAHTQQSPSLGRTEKEGLADLYAKRQAKRLGISATARGEDYKPYRQKARAETTPAYQMRGQFKGGRGSQNRRSSPPPPLPRKVQAAINKSSKAIDRVLDIAAKNPPLVHSRLQLKKAKPDTYRTPAGDVVRKFPDGHVKVIDHIEPRENPKIQGPQEKRLAKNLLKAAANRVQIDADLTPEQMEFAKAFSKSAGVSPQFAAAAVLYEGGNNTPGDQNWLNIGWTGSGRADITYNPVWQGDPAQAGKLTGQWLNGQWGQQDGYVAAPAIQEITSNKGDVAQGEAWATSGWAASGAGPLNTIDQVSATTTPLPKGLKQRAMQELGKKATQDILQGDTGTTAPAAKPHLVKGFLKNIVKSAGLPTAEDLGVKNDKVVLGNIHPELQKALIKLNKQTGITPEVNEGFRTYDYQASLDATPGLYAASAGTSNHESGLAVDIDNHAQYSDEQLAAVGLRKLTPEGGADPEHLELINMPPALVGPKAGEAATGSTGAVPSSSGGTSYAPSTSTSGGGIPTTGGTGIPSLTKTPKPRFSQAKLLKAIGEDQGFNQLFGGAAPPPAEQDATMAAMAEIAATRKRLLKR